MHRNYTVFFSDKEAAIDFVRKTNKHEPEVFEALGVSVSTLVDAIKRLELGCMGEGEKEDDIIAHGGRWMIRLEVKIVEYGDKAVFPNGFSMVKRHFVSVTREGLVEYVHKRK
jgi:hypothetical protein